MNNNENDIREMPYAEWLEGALRRISVMPMRTLILIGITEDGDTYNDYYNATMGDKLMIAGMIQQDAMLDTLEANGYIKSMDDDDEEGDEYWRRRAIMIFSMVLYLMNTSRSL